MHCILQAYIPQRVCREVRVVSCTFPMPCNVYNYTYIAQVCIVIGVRQFVYTVLTRCIMYVFVYRQYLVILTINIHSMLLLIPF